MKAGATKLGWADWATDRGGKIGLAWVAMTTETLA